MMKRLFTRCICNNIHREKGVFNWTSFSNVPVQQQIRNKYGIISNALYSVCTKYDSENLKRGFCVNLSMKETEMLRSHPTCTFKWNMEIKLILLFQQYWIREAVWEFRRTISHTHCESQIATIMATWTKYSFTQLQVSLHLNTSFVLMHTSCFGRQFFDNGKYTKSWTIILLKCIFLWSNRWCGTK